MLALIHDAVGHLVVPFDRLPKAVAVLEQIAGTLIEQQMLLRETLIGQKGSALARSAVDGTEEAPSLAYAVVKRDLRFVSVSNSYAFLFDLKPPQFRQMLLNDLLHPGDVLPFDRSIKQLLSGKVGSCELVHWRATGSGHFVLTRDTLWAIGKVKVRGPEYIATVSEKIPQQDEAKMLVERAKLKIRRS